MHYFIDGYNMLFRVMRENEDLQTSRDTIIRDFDEKISLTRMNVSIVFDAAFQASPRTKSHYRAIEIVFTAEGEIADEYIVEEISNSSHPEQETVVTSDKELSRRIRNCGAHTETIEEFMLLLNRTYQNKLRHLKLEKKKKALPSTPPLGARSQIPSSTDSPEVCIDYYYQVFESKWQSILEQEKAARQIKHSLSEEKKRPRKTKIKQDPFALPQAAEERVKSEMERWQKEFERRLRE